MVRTVLLIGTLDTKGAEVGYVRDLLQRSHVNPLSAAPRVRVDGRPPRNAGVKPLDQDIEQAMGF